MKHSKIFLGFTTCLLTIAAVAAAKKFGPPKTRLYCTTCHAPGYCEPTAQTFIYTQTGLDPIVTIVVDDCMTGSPVSRIVYTSGIVNGRCSGTNCIHSLIKVGN